MRRTPKTPLLSISIATLRFTLYYLVTNCILIALAVVAHGEDSFPVLWWGSRVESTSVKGQELGNFANSFQWSLTVAGATIQSPPLPAQKSYSYTTNFLSAENPISEGGIWRHEGNFWAKVRTADGHAVGTQSGLGGYDDSYAYLTGFLPNQTAQAILWKGPATNNDISEVELLLRWADSPTNARGYECNLSLNGDYAQIVRWNGKFGDFTYLADQHSFSSGTMPPNSGDILRASITGDTIKVYLNKNDGRGDRLIVTAADATHQDGNPGMGFFRQVRASQGGRWRKIVDMFRQRLGRLIWPIVDQTQFGFSSFTASSD